jgi:hypothetical protein
VFVHRIASSGPCLLDRLVAAGGLPRARLLDSLIAVGGLLDRLVATGGPHPLRLRDRRAAARVFVRCSSGSSLPVDFVRLDLNLSQLAPSGSACLDLGGSAQLDSAGSVGQFFFFLRQFICSTK